MRKALVILIMGIVILTQIPLEVSEEEYDYITGFVKMQERNLKVTVYYLEGEKAWAQYILDVTVKALPILENLAGFPYPYEYDVNIYAKSNEEMGGWGGKNLEGEIWINRGIFTPKVIKTVDNSIIHELAHYWAGSIIYKKTWMREGFAELLSYLTLGKMKKEKAAISEKTNWFNKFKNYHSYDFPLDEWQSLHNAPFDYAKEYNNLAYGKSAVFCYNIYEKHGLSTIQKINKHLYENNIKADSLIYMELLEKLTGENQKDFFIGWIFPGKYEGQEEAENKIKELKKLKSTLNILIRKKYGFDDYISTRVGEAEEALRELDFKKASEIAGEEIQRINRAMSEFEKHAKNYLKAEEYYNSKNIIFERTPPKSKLLNAKSNLLSFNYDVFENYLEEFYEEMEKLEEYYPDLETKYKELEVIAKNYISYTSLAHIPYLISQEKYEEAMIQMNQILNVIREYELIEKKLENLDIFTKIGIMLFGKGMPKIGEDMKFAKTRIRQEMFENTSEILTQIDIELSEAKKYGIMSSLIILFGILAIFYLSIRWRRRIRKGKKEEIELRRTKKMRENTNSRRTLRQRKNRNS